MTIARSQIDFFDRFIKIKVEEKYTIWAVGHACRTLVMTIYSNEIERPTPESTEIPQGRFFSMHDILKFDPYSQWKEWDMAAFREAEELAKSSYNTQRADRIRGILFGQAVGDALGFGAEWISKQQVTEKYPDGLEDYQQIVRYKNLESWSPGDWTDDTDQMLCILDSLLAKKKLDINDIAARIHHWAMTDGFGMGRTVCAVVNTPGFLENPEATARQVWEDSGRTWAANGAVMRTSVLGIWQHPSKQHVIENAERVSRITHSDSRCLGSCVAVCLALRALISGERNVAALVRHIACEVKGYHPEFQEYFSKAATSLEALDLDEGLNPGEINRAAYTLKTMGAGFWALQHAQSYREGLLEVIREGGDADTNGAVAGALLGAKFGYRAIPQVWIEGLVYKQELAAKVERLIEIIESS